MSTSASIVVVPCKGTQHLGPNNVASVCMGFYVYSIKLYLVEYVDEFLGERGMFFLRDAYCIE